MRDSETESEDTTQRTATSAKWSTMHIERTHHRFAVVFVHPSSREIHPVFLGRDPWGAQEAHAAGHCAGGCGGDRLPSEKRRSLSKDNCVVCCLQVS